MREIPGRRGNGGGRRTSRGLLALSVLAVAILASATAGSATTSPPAGSDTVVSALGASGAREVHYLCAAKKGGVLRYVTKPGRCSGRENAIKVSAERPITACASADSELVRRIPSSGKCRAGETRMVLPGKEPQRFCAAAGAGRLIYNPNSACEPEDIPLVVSAANRAPSARDGSASVAEDGTVDVTLRATDPDGDRLTYSLENDPGHGDVTGSGTDRTYTPDPDFNGKDVFTFRVSDGNGGTDTAKVTIDVTPVNDAPVPADDSKFTPENTPLSFPASDLLANDSKGPPNENGQVLTVTQVSNPQHGGVNLDTKGNGDPSDDEITFTPQTDFKGPASFEYEVCDDGSPQECSTQTATVNVAVTPVNSKPVATDGVRTMDEDDPPITIDLAALVSDVETIDADLTYTIVNGPSAAQGELTGSGFSRDFDSADDFNGQVAIDYKVTDRGDPDNCGAPGVDCAASEESAVETVTVTVDPVNDAPVSTADDYEVDEDAALDVADGPDDVLANDADVDNDPLTAVLVSDPSHEDAFTLNSDGSFSYEPEADYDGDDSFTYKANDGTTDGNTVTVTITVKPVNDAPVNTVPAGPFTAAQDKDVPVSGLSVADLDAGGGEIEVTLDVDHGAITIKDDVAGGLTAGDIVGSGGSGPVALTGTLAKINATLADPNGLVYHSAAAFTGTDTLTITTDDRGNTGTGGAQTDTDTLDLDVKKINDAPIPTDDDRTVAEDGTLTFFASTLAANDSPGANEAGQTLTVTAVNSTADTHGTVSLDDKANADPADDEVRYVPDANYNGSASFDYTVQDDGGTANGGQDTATGTVNVTITAVNDAPVATDDSRTTDEDTDLVVAASDLATNDDKGPVSATDETSQNLTVTAVGNASGGAVTLSNGQITFDPNNDFNGLASFEYTVRDDGRTDGSDDFKTDTGTVHVTVTAVNDAPVNSVPGSQTVDEDTALTFSPSLSTSDIDASSNDVRLTLDVDHGTLTLATMTGLSFSTGDGTDDAEIDVTGTISEVNAALDGLTYKGNSNYSGSDTLTIITNDLGNTGSGGAKSDTDTVGITVNPVNDAPVADDETFNGASSAIGNTSLIVNDPDDGAPNQSGPKKTITGDILAGDTDIDGPGPLTVTPGTFATNDGGSVTIQDDGDFTFHPAASTSCTDTSDFFDYSLEDSGDPEQTDTGRVTISIAGCVWYVSNNAAGNIGTSQAPFDTLAQAETASDANHTVFVYDGDNTTTGYDADGYQMNAGERLIGEHEGLTVDPDQGGALTAEALHPANVGAHPTFTATNADVIDLDDGNELRGFNVDPGGTGGGIFGGSGDTGGGTIDDVNIIDQGTAGTQPGLELDATTGTFNVTSFVVANKAHGVLLNNAGTVDFGGDSSQVSLSTEGGPAFTASGTNMGTSQIDDITVTNSTNGAVDMDTTTGTTTLGDDTGTDLNLTTTSGAEPALDLNSAGTLAVGGGGTDELHATGGPALDVTSTDGPSLDFDDVDSTNSPTDGVNLDGLGTGTFSASSGDITGASGIAFDLNGGSGAITYPGNLNNGSGSTAEITGRTGGAVTLSGQLNDNNDPGGGINLGSNTGGTTTFSNAIKTLNTGSGDALLFNNSDGHTLTLSGGGLDIDTTSGKGLEAATSGTLVVSGTTNTIDTGTGRALNISNTDIGAGNVTLQRVSANGASNGIQLDNTGSAGRLVVGPSTGGPCNSVATCAGGAIQNSTGPAVSLTNTRNVSFTEMFILNGATHGISGTTMTDASGGTNPTFELKNSFLESPGDGDNESAIFFDTPNAANITGRMAVSDTTIQNFEDVGLHVGNTSGALTVDVTNVTFNNNSDTNGEEGIDIFAEGTANTTVNVGENSTFTDLEGGAMNIASQQSGDVDMNINGTTTTGTGGPDNFPTPPAMTFSSEGGSSGMTFDITNNDIIDSSGDGIFIGHEGAIMGRVTGNDVSGMALGDGLRIDTDTAASNTATILVDNNNFGNVAGNTGIGDDGIQVLHRDGTKTLNLTVTNNQIKNTDSEGIRYFADDDVSGGGPGNNVRISNNQFGNNGVEDLSDSIVMISQDPGTDLCTNIIGNTSMEGITLQQTLSAVLQITQSSTAALASDNGGTTVTPSGSITFNGSCSTPPQPTNP